MTIPEEGRERLQKYIDVAEYQLKILGETRTILCGVMTTITAAGENSPLKAQVLTEAVEDEEVRNAMELCALFKAESACLIGDYWQATGFRKALYARTLALVTFESTLTLRKLLGPKFRNAIVARLGSNSGTPLKSIHGRICKIHEEARTQFGDLRNNLVGHRIQDAETRQKLLSEFDGELVVALAVKLHPILKELYENLVPYTLKSATALREIAASIRADIGPGVSKTSS